MFWVAALSHCVVTPAFFVQIPLFFVVKPAFYSFFAQPQGVVNVAYMDTIFADGKN